MRYFYCHCCQCTLEEGQTTLMEEPVTSEFWGARSTTIMQYRVCDICGDDVEETSAPDLNLDDPEEECEA